jgi:Spy/CpxP family protein refolding chaperone
MNNMHKIIVAFLATSCIALGANTASAGARGGDCHWENSHRGGKTWREDTKERIEARHERLHKALKLTEAQEPAWKAFIAKAAPEGWERPDPKEFSKLTTPEQFEKRLEFSKKHLEFMSQRLTALKTFYAQLSPEQQKIFDERHRAPNRGDRRQKGKRR